VRRENPSTTQALIPAVLTFTFRLDESLRNSFSTAAKARDRTGAQLLRDFMRDFVRQQQDAAEHDAWFRRQVQIGRDSASAGDLVSAEEVEAEATVWRAETRRKLANITS
jgi:predicted transcriptional regulator